VAVKSLSPRIKNILHSTHTLKAKLYNYNYTKQGELINRGIKRKTITRVWDNACPTQFSLWIRVLGKIEASWEKNSLENASD